MVLRSQMENITDKDKEGFEVILKEAMVCTTLYSVNYGSFTWEITGHPFVFQMT